MSESTATPSAPAAPAAATPGTGGADPGAPGVPRRRELRRTSAPNAPPATTTAPGGTETGRAAPTANASADVSMNDALAQLTRRRREARGVTEPAGPQRPAEHPAAVSPAERAALAGAPAPRPAPAPAAPAAAPAAPAAAEADPIARAISELGKPGGAAPDEAGAPAGTAADPGAGAVTVKVAGKDRSLTHAQIADAVTRAEGFTQKAQQLAELTKQVNEQHAMVQQLLPVLIPAMERELKAVEKQLGAEPNWTELARSMDPAKYQALDAEWKEFRSEQQKLAMMADAQNRDTETQRRQRLSQGHAQLVKAIPSWADPKARQTITAEIRAYGKRNGYSDAEMNTIYEPRHVVTLLHALAWEKAMNGVNTRPVVVPNAGRGALPPPDAAPVETAAQRFGERANVANGAQLLRARRAANGRGPAG